MRGNTFTAIGRENGIKRKKAAEKGGGRDTAEERRANVNAALNMHSGSSLDDK